MKIHRMVMISCALFFLGVNFALAQKVSGPLSSEVRQFKQRQEAVIDRMNKKIKQLERDHPQFIEKNKQSIEIMKASQEYLQSSIESLESGDLESAFQDQTVFMSDMAGVFVEGINFIKKNEEHKKMPIGTFLNQKGKNVSFPKEKKVMEGEKPFYESEMTQPMDIVSHSQKESEPMPTEKISHMDAMTEKSEKEFQKKSNQEELQVTPAGAEGGGLGDGGQGGSSDSGGAVLPLKGKDLGGGAPTGANSDAPAGDGGGSFGGDAGGDGGAGGRGLGGKKEDEKPWLRSDDGNESALLEVPEGSTKLLEAKPLRSQKKSSEGKGNGSGAGAGAGSGHGTASGDGTSSGRGGVNASSGDGESVGKSGDDSTDSALDSRLRAINASAGPLSFINGRGNDNVAQATSGDAIAGNVAGDGAGSGAGNASGDGAGSDSGAGIADGELGSRILAKERSESRLTDKTNPAELFGGKSGNDNVDGESAGKSGSGQTEGNNAASASRGTSAGDLAGASDGISSAGAGAGNSEVESDAVSTGKGGERLARTSAMPTDSGEGFTEEAADQSGHGKTQGTSSGDGSGSGSGAGNIGAGDGESAGKSGNNQTETRNVAQATNDDATAGKASSDDAGSGSGVGNAGAGEGVGEGSGGNAGTGPDTDQVLELTNEQAPPQSEGSEAKDRARDPNKADASSADSEFDADRQKQGGGNTLTVQETTTQTTVAKEISEIEPEDIDLNQRFEENEFDVSGLSNEEEEVLPTYEETEGQHFDEETLDQTKIVSTIKEWLLQERLLIQELKKFKPVKQPNNPNPPWEYYVLRQKQILHPMKQIRRRIEFLGTKDDYIIELRKLSNVGNRLLDLLNRGDYTEYKAASKAYDDLLRELDSIERKVETIDQKIVAYHIEEDDVMPEAYRSPVSRYFQMLSEV